MPHAFVSDSPDRDLDAARRRDEDAFARLVQPHRAGLQAHCYRMLGSAADAEDAVQDTLVRAWRALPAFEGRSSLRSWLHRIATNVALRMIERRPRRVLPVDYGPAHDPHDALGGPAVESIWIDPYPDDAIADGSPSPDARLEERESVELAFVAAVQHLPARQRAVLLLRDVLGYAPAEIARILDTSPAAVSSALQRAHGAVDQRLPERSQQATLRAIGDSRVREVVESYVRAWEDGDVPALVALLADEVTLSMPPRPGWYRGRETVRDFLVAYPFSQPRRWRHVPVRANGQVAFGLYWTADRGPLEAHAIKLLTFDATARISDVTTFHTPEAFARFGLPLALSD